MSKPENIQRFVKARDKEWGRLENPLYSKRTGKFLRGPGWQTGKGFVFEKDVIARQCREKNVRAHFGRLLEICSIKNWERELEFQEEKCRVVYRGDDAKDEFGFMAVYSEQGTASSHMSGAKFVDAVGAAPGNDAEDSDALGAYTQILLGEDCPPTYISLPKTRWPRWWHTAGFKNPVVLLTVNLYGHPRAGFYWEKFSDKCLRELGWVRVIGLESLYFHKVFHLFLNRYVDDFKMAGWKDNLAKAWDLLLGKLDLDVPVKSINNTYLGMTQRPCKIPISLVRQHDEMRRRMATDEKFRTANEDTPATNLSKTP